MEEQWTWALGVLIAAYALSAFSEYAWALWVAVAAALPIVLMLNSEPTPGF